MNYFPVNLNLRGRSVLVIGGGGVGSRKLQKLWESGALLTLIDPEPSSEIVTWCQDKKIPIRLRSYQEGDLKSFSVVIAATQDRLINLKIREEANQNSILLNIVDKPEFCDFTFPAIVSRGEFLIAISTGGSSPALSRKVREDLEALYGDEYGVFVSLIRKIREDLIRKNIPGREHLLSHFVRSEALQMIRDQKKHELEKLLKEHFGDVLDVRGLLYAESSSVF